MKKVALIVALTFVSCASGTVYTPSSSFTPTNAREINDEDIKKAYYAKPQIMTPAALAFYNLTKEEKQFERGLNGVQNIKSVYTIPSIMVEGLATDDHRYHSHKPSAPLSVKKLRLLGARAHADLLLIYANQARAEVDVNGWVVSSILLLTPLFVPMYDMQVTMTVSVWLMDIRNGYLYKEISLTERGSEGYLTLAGQSAAKRRLMKKLKGKLLPLVYAELNKAMAKGSKAPAACPTCPVCPTTRPAGAPVAPIASPTGR